MDLMNVLTITYEQRKSYPYNGDCDDNGKRKNNPQTQRIHIGLSGAKRSQVY